LATKYGTCHHLPVSETPKHHSLKVDQAKYLNNREEMNQALTNFTDAHNSLIQNKDDYMNNQHLGAGGWHF